MPDQHSDVVYQKDDGIAWIRLNRPEQRNAQDTSLLTSLDSAVSAAAVDAEVRVIVLAGNGEHFSAGHDLKTAENYGKGCTVEERFAYESQYYYDICMRIWDVPKPTIASVQGGCIAAGFMLANMCDLIVASEDAFFCDPVVHLFGAAAVEVLIHPSAVGLRKAKDLLFTGRRMDAREAFDCGMVSRLVPRAQLHEETRALAAQIAQAPPFALTLVKRSLHRMADIQGLRASLQAHFDTHQLAHVSDEFISKNTGGLTKALPPPSAPGRGPVVRQV
jgi:enoyl-CoA hydratase